MNFLRSIVFVPVAAAIVCLGGAGMAQDREGYYASVSGLFVLPRDTDWSDRLGAVDIPMKNGFGILAAGGRILASGLRVEFELGYRSYDFEKETRVQPEGDFSTVSLMANGIYSFDLEGFRPYAGLGLGVATHTAEITGSSVVFGKGEASVFAYQVLAGVGYPLSDRAEILLGYRYFGTGEGDYGQGVSITPANHSFEIGVLYSF